MRKLLLASILALAMLPASAAARGRRGGFYRPVIVPQVWFGYGWQNPFWGPYPYYQPYAYARPNTGKVKLETNAKDAEVYINGSYAGTVGDLKSIPLKSGSYTIELREPGGRQYQEKVYVVPGKTIHLHPDPDLRDGS
jgi:PEGA domain